MPDTSKTDAPRAQPLADPKKLVSQYAQTCVQYVEKSVGVAMDFTVDTLPVLDHYLREARTAAAQRPETGPLIATVAGCYIGEVLRNRHGLSWDTRAEEPLAWTLQGARGAVTVFPVGLAKVALEGARAEGSIQVFSFEPLLLESLSARLDELPAVGEDEYVAPSTRVEVVDMAMDLAVAMKPRERVRCHCDNEGDEIQ